MNISSHVYDNIRKVKNKVLSIQPAQPLPRSTRRT